MLTWPHSDTDWAPWLDRVEPLYREIAGHIAAREALLLVCRDEAHRRAVAAGLQALPPTAQARIQYALADSNDSWTRDHGPITLLDNDARPLLLDFRFNGWGGKYPAELDDAINIKLHRQGGFGSTAMQSLDFVLEGGSIETDGQGTLLSTTQCLLAPTRNPGLGQADIENRLKHYLGITRILWLHHGALAGDDTDAHIDTLVRFADPSTLVYMSCDDPADEHYAPLQAMAGELQRLRTASGEPYRLIPLPLPAPVFDASGRRLPASYVNFLIINGAVLAPVYADAADEQALQGLARAFPEHEIIALDCRPLIQQNGSLHCITMQLPQGVLPPCESQS